MTTPDIAGLFTPDGAVAFLLGVAARSVWSWAKNRYLDWRDPANAPHRERLKTVVLGVGLTVIAFIYGGITQQRTHDATIKQAAITAQQAKDAKKLAANVAWDQYLAGEERCALVEWLATGLVPPAEFFSLHTTDPRYQQWARGVNQQYFDRLAAIEKQREAPNSPPADFTFKEPKCAK